MPSTISATEMPLACHTWCHLPRPRAGSRWQHKVPPPLLPAHCYRGKCVPVLLSAYLYGLMLQMVTAGKGSLWNWTVTETEVV